MPHSQDNRMQEYRTIALSKQFYRITTGNEHVYICFQNPKELHELADFMNEMADEWEDEEDNDHNHNDNCDGEHGYE